MAKVFGVDVDDITSVFTEEAAEEFPIKPAEPQNSDTVDENFEKKKRRVEERLKEFKNASASEPSPSNPDDKVISSIESILAKSPKVKIYKIPAPESCTHSVAYPPNLDFKPLTRYPLDAMEIPFKLDPFQEQALQCIENNESVMVAAHTSAGKTLIAEYAIAKALKQKQRVIYTTPIKALSNQKFREFLKYEDVGLMTGDATIHPNATVLIMTTEILQSMLYRGSAIIREVAWVVFDEIHYMRDPERGVVWEESLVLLADRVRLVFLSATTPNARQFAEWIATLHSQPCHVVATETRPVPLCHFVYPLGGSGLTLVLDNDGKFEEERFRRAMSDFPKVQEIGPSTSRRSRQTTGGENLETGVVKMVRLVKQYQLEPVIVFSFSKKECEIYALKMVDFDFLTENERCLVEAVFNNAIDGLSAEDRTLPQITNLLPLLKKGIGIHHGGLLPILKETVEILFSEGYIKCLFATETFAMGLNMPARTVVFTSIRKYDGVTYRWLTAGEYIQMSGRAGRRGKDERGTVIVMLEEGIPEAAARAMLCGEAAPLNSAFHITYNMLLNLLRVEEISPEFLMERSFYQFQTLARVPEIAAELTGLVEKLKSSSLGEEEASVESYYKMKLCVQETQQQQWRYIRRPHNIINFLQVGRLVRVESDGHDYGWGVVINLKKQAKRDRASSLETFYIVDCLLARPASKKEAPFVEEASSSWIPVPSGSKKPAPTDQSGGQGESSSATAGSDGGGGSGEGVEEGAKPRLVVDVVPVRLECLCGISMVRLKVPANLLRRETREALFATIENVKTQLGVTELPPLDPVKDMHITEGSFLEVTERLKTFTSRLEAHPLHSSERLPELLAAYEARVALRRRVDELRRRLQEHVSLIQMQELAARKRVLRRLGFIGDPAAGGAGSGSGSAVLELKGRVACEISSADELVLTELLFEGVFNRLSPEQIAALLSCFVFDEKGVDMPKIGSELAEALRTLQATARRVARISEECRLASVKDEDSYVDSFKPYLMELVLAWAHGVSFKSLTTQSFLFEGTIIRSLRLLEELLRQMINAARTIGNSELEAKFALAIEKIKRDIVFAASLYL